MMGKKARYRKTATRVVALVMGILMLAGIFFEAVLSAMM